MRAWIVILLLIGTMAYAIAEDITLTTYYPTHCGLTRAHKSAQIFVSP